MPCDCERAIAELRAEVDALSRAHDAIFDKLDRAVDNIEAKHQTLMALVKQGMRESLARIESALRMPPPPERDDPPRCH